MSSEEFPEVVKTPSTFHGRMDQVSMLVHEHLKGDRDISTAVSMALQVAGFNIDGGQRQIPDNLLAVEDFEDGDFAVVPARGGGVYLFERYPEDNPLVIEEGGRRLRVKDYGVHPPLNDLLPPCSERTGLVSFELTDEEIDYPGDGSKRRWVIDRGEGFNICSDLSGGDKPTCWIWKQRNELE